MTSNSTMVDYYKRKSKLAAKNETIPDPKWKYTYYGFMIDLLEEIKIRYKEDYKKDFPEYEIATSPLYFVSTGGDSAGENGGGFGYRSIPKTGAGAKKEEAPAAAEGGVPPGQLFHGLVKEVFCNKVMIAVF